MDHPVYCESLVNLMKTLKFSLIFFSVKTLHFSAKRFVFDFKVFSLFDDEILFLLIVLVPQIFLGKFLNINCFFLDSAIEYLCFNFHLCLSCEIYLLLRILYSWPFFSERYPSVVILSMFYGNELNWFQMKIQKFHAKLRKK